MSDLESTKPYSLEFELRPSYLYVNIRGDENNYTIARAYWDEIIILRKQTASSNVLVHKEIRPSLTTVDSFKLGTELADSGFEHVKVAFCDRYASPAEMSFSENVMTNRGMKFGTFTNIEQAKDWLLST